MSEPTLKTPIVDGYEVDKVLACRLAQSYDRPWRREGGLELLKGAGVLSVWVDGSRSGRSKEYMWVAGPLSSRKFGSRDIDTLELADGMISERPVFRILLRGQAHDYHFYVKADTLQDAMDQFEAASVMCS